MCVASSVMFQEDSEEGEETQEEPGSQQEAGDQGQEVDVLSVVEEEPEDCADVPDTQDRPKTVSFRLNITCL